jgi:hypothetical protein
VLFLCHLSKLFKVFKKLKFPDRHLPLDKGTWSTILALDCLGECTKEIADLGKTFFVHRHLLCAGGHRLIHTVRKRAGVELDDVADLD